MATPSLVTGEAVSAEEDTEEELQEETVERRAVEALLDISEAAYMRELEPSEYPSDSGWEEAVQGWAKAHPMGGIFLASKTCSQPKQKKAATPGPSPANLTNPNTNRSKSNAKHQSDSYVGQHNSFHKSVLPNKHTGMWSNAASETTVSPLINATQESASSLSLKEKVEKEKMLRETHQASSRNSLMEDRLSKAQKYSHRPNSTVVPIKNFTFLPPIHPTQLYNQRHSGRKAEDRGLKGENCFMWHNKNRTRGLRVDPVTNSEHPANSAPLTSMSWKCQHNPLLFSSAGVSIP